MDESCFFVLARVWDGNWILEMFLYVIECHTDWRVKFYGSIKFVTGVNLACLLHQFFPWCCALSWQGGLWALMILRPLAWRPMTPGSESQVQLEATRLTTIISPRTTTTTGTWNIRTMYETGKTAQVTTKMRNYRLSILGISELRWTGSGQRRLISGELLLFSEHENAPHTQGVVLMPSRTDQKALVGWEGHGSQIITATFHTN